MRNRKTGHIFLIDYHPAYLILNILPSIHKRNSEQKISTIRLNLYIERSFNSFLLCFRIEKKSLVVCIATIQCKQKILLYFFSTTHFPIKRKRVIYAKQPKLAQNEYKLNIIKVWRVNEKNTHRQIIPTKKKNKKKWIEKKLLLLFEIHEEVMYSKMNVANVFNIASTPSESNVN